MLEKERLRNDYLHKIQFCSEKFDFYDSNKDILEKKERLRHLKDITALLDDKSMVESLVIPYIDHLMDLIKNNIFRNLQEKQTKEVIRYEDGEISYGLWNDIQPVYELFLQIIINDAIEGRNLKKFITDPFIHMFLELFDSKEQREREYLKHILFRLYAKLVSKRKMIRKAIADYLQSLVYEKNDFNGSTELLPILASIISGFAVPLRQEHVHFFKTIMIPLMKVQYLFLDTDEFLKCVMIFIGKDLSLSIPFIEGLLRYWPISNPNKELIFISWLREVLEVCTITDLKPIIPKLFARLTKCISAPHLMLSDRTLSLFENECFLAILKHYKKEAFSLFVPAACGLADTYWHESIRESLVALQEILKEIDPKKFVRAKNNKDPKAVYLLQDPQYYKKEKLNFDEKWKLLAEQIQFKNHDLKG